MLGIIFPFYFLTLSIIYINMLMDFFWAQVHFHTPLDYFCLGHLKYYTTAFLTLYNYKLKYSLYT